ncbi:MAG: nickel pincer cofactor biosynthesis protein LarC [Lachnospiraceae bacterium]|nr:nickel pincer cofactor biosynthesis protein LarC [Lachnospiraceae bacterium]
MSILYLECNTGISGDMAVAALLDLGADREGLMKVLSGIKDDGFSVEISRVKKGGIDCCDFAVRLDAAHENHDHDMAYLYGESAQTHHEHDHDHAHHDHDHNHEHHHHDHEHHHHDHDHHEHHHHDHDHDHHDHDHGHHHHEHRGMKEIREIMDALDLTEGARALADRIFSIIAEAEAKAHGIPVEEVHFHEVGALDSIVDVVSAAYCLDDLGVDQVIIPFIAEGSGTVRCQHGVLPVPVPAVEGIARACGLPLRLTSRKGELVTPTGAAIAAAVRTGGTLPETVRILKTGYGAGKRAYEIPSILRAMLIEPAQEAGKDEIWKLECEIDDSTGEQLGFAMKCLMTAGALDAHYSPVYMKKNRPAWTLTVLCRDEKREALERVIFTQTTTIGIRRCRMERSTLPRRAGKVRTPYGEIEVKYCRVGEAERCCPEYESVAEAVRRTGAAFADVYRSAQR